MQTLASSPIAVGAAAGIASERPIDLVHLARMSLGDRSLEREVLQLFVCQAAVLLQRMEDAGPPEVAMLAHTLKGAAQGTGAWRVATAAEALEVATAGDAAALARALAALSGAVAEASAIIADLLRAH